MRAVSPFCFDDRFYLSSLAKLEAAGVLILSALEKRCTLLAEKTGLVDYTLTNTSPREALEWILSGWHNAWTSCEPTWRSLLEVLKKMNLEDLAQEILEYLNGE